MSALVSLKVLGMLLHSTSAILTSRILSVQLTGSLSCSEDFHVTCTETSTIVGKNHTFQYLLCELICLEVYLIDNKFTYTMFSNVSYISLDIDSHFIITLLVNDLCCPCSRWIIQCKERYISIKFKRFSGIKRTSSPCFLLLNSCRGSFLVWGTSRAKSSPVGGTGESRL